jgi:hypothetical protein
VKLSIRGGIAALTIAGAAVIAAGCGGSDSGSAGAAKNAAALDFVPKDAIGYATIDTDLEGKAWTAFEDVYPAFNGEFKGLDEWTTSLTEDTEVVDFEKDVEPWLGDSAGLAIISATGGGAEGDDPGIFAWVELKDSAKFETFAKDNDIKDADEKIGDFAVWTSTEDDAYIGVSDDLAVIANSKKELKARIEFDGDSITDAEGVGDAIDEVAGDENMATVVVSGAGIRAALKDSEDGTATAAADLEQVKDLEAVALSFGATDDGLRLDGFVGSSAESETKNVSNKVFEALPADTVLALGGAELGTGLGGILDSAGKDNAQIQQGVGAVSGLLGITVADFEDAMSGSFALSISASDEGLGGIVGGVAGAALGGGAVGADQLSGLLASGAVTLAFEETGETAATLEKVVGGVSGLTGGSRATAQGKTAGDFTTKTVGVQGIPVTVASSDDVAGLSVGLDVFSTWGAESLGDTDGFKDAWKAADAPDETVGSMWLDWPRVATLAGFEGAEGTEAGGWVGWVEADDTNAKFSVFMHVAKS